MGMTTLKSVPCPMFEVFIENILVDRDSEKNAFRVPVPVFAESTKDHPRALSVERTFINRDIVVVNEAAQKDPENQDQKFRNKWFIPWSYFK